MTSQAVIQKLRQLRVLVIHPIDQDGEELHRQLKRIGCQAELKWPQGAGLPADIDVAFFLLEPVGGLQRSNELVIATRVATVAIMDPENPTILKALLDSGACGVLIKPIRPAGVLSSLILGISTKSYER